MSDHSLQQKSMQQQIDTLSALNAKLFPLATPAQKAKYLLESTPVAQFLASSKILNQYLAGADPENQFVLLSILALHQGPVVFRGIESIKNPEEALDKLLQQLIPVEKNYQALGGIIGYHLMILKLIQESHTVPDPAASSKTSFLKPEGLDISQNNATVKKYIRAGIEALPLMAEIYPVGGAGDRLDLMDPKTKEPLPTARLEFCGKNLLAGLFEDLTAREFLYFQLTGKQVITPVALMTSHEKNNHQHILDMCETNRWFGRPKDSIRYFIQPLVPVVTIEGNWCLTGPLQLKLKPGGHGVLWKLAHEADIFDWFKSLKREKMLIRQINNPIAGVDYGLLAFIGYGFKENKVFGFASCPRLLNAHEGMNVIIENRKEGKYQYCLTNLEYTDFTKKGIHDIPEKPGSPYSALPSNTNILFAEIPSLQEIILHCPIPGLLINMKTNMSYINPEGEISELPASRLESTMQNIADYIIDEFPHPLRPHEFSRLKSYLTYNLRRKTLSVTKILYKPGKELLSTPEGCLFEMLENYVELFRDYCGFKIPDLGSPENYLEKGPPFYIHIHPAIGPVFSIIAQKLRGGHLHPGAELQLDIAEIDIENLDLQGTLRINGNSPGLCTLKNITVKNKGMDYQASRPLWAHQFKRHEELLIYLEENSEFMAENVTFNGEHTIRVPAGKRMIAWQEGEKVNFGMDKITGTRWLYSFNAANDIFLTKGNGT